GADPTCMETTPATTLMADFRTGDEWMTRDNDLSPSQSLVGDSMNSAIIRTLCPPRPAKLLYPTSYTAPTPNTPPPRPHPQTHTIFPMFGL
ncbi:hypothetical protein BaRGS_00038381, partial [Batillaria attramentaria]